MTKIVFYKSGSTYYGFHETGHTGYDDAGKDIVCSALSAMTMLLINTVEVAIGSNVEYIIDDKTTDIEVIAKGALPKYETDSKKCFAVSSVMLGYYLQLNDMLEDYYDYLELDETEREI